MHCETDKRNHVIWIIISDLKLYFRFEIKLPLWFRTVLAALIYFLSC